jgi:four helix bundle protein
MNPKDLQQRTKTFAVRIIKLVKFLQRDPIGRIIANQQLLRSGTAVAANYRAVCRAKSAKDFISKLSIVIVRMQPARPVLNSYVERSWGRQ